MATGVTDALFDGDDAANTPLSAEEREELIPTYIALRSELNEAEQIGIADAERWVFSRRRDVLDSNLLKRLHKRMLGNVWRWAGTFRTSPRNIGIDAYLIPVELRQLYEDVRYQIDNGIYPPDEIAVRFHHRLVFIHAFPNGNGRHARLAADLLAVQVGTKRFTWGRANLVNAAEARARYVTALRSADGHDIGPLLSFARS
jgi:Fic-DOC domain mobile mystery protein B